MKKEIQFSLVYRDMWQSSGKYVPRKDQLARIAPVIIDMGCLAKQGKNQSHFRRRCSCACACAVSAAAARFTACRRHGSFRCAVSDSRD